MRILVALFLFLPFSLWSKPTSNVINVIYSLPDEFFVQYGFPELSFAERVEICEKINGRIEKDSLKIGGKSIYDKYSFELYGDFTGQQKTDKLLFKLVKDKSNKRYLLLVFHRTERDQWKKLERIDVFQYDKSVEGRWKTINAGDVLPKLTWSDFLSGITDDALKDVFTMRPILDAVFLEDGSIELDVAFSYIETEMDEVYDYIINNSIDAKIAILYWRKKKSKFVAAISDH